jgi:hypothetical protein
VGEGSLVVARCFGVGRRGAAPGLCWLLGWAGGTRLEVWQCWGTVQGLRGPVDCPAKMGGCEIVTQSQSGQKQSGARAAVWARGRASDSGRGAGRLRRARRPADARRAFWAPAGAGEGAGQRVSAVPPPAAPAPTRRRPASPPAPAGAAARARAAHFRHWQNGSLGSLRCSGTSGSWHDSGSGQGRGCWNSAGSMVAPNPGAQSGRAGRAARGGRASAGAGRGGAGRGGGGRAARRRPRPAAPSVGGSARHPARGRARSAPPARPPARPPVRPRALTAGARRRGRVARRALPAEVCALQVARGAAEHVAARRAALRGQGDQQGGQERGGGAAAAEAAARGPEGAGRPRGGGRVRAARPPRRARRLPAARRASLRRAGRRTLRRRAAAQSRARICARAPARHLPCAPGSPQRLHPGRAAWVGRRRVGVRGAPAASRTGEKRRARDKGCDAPGGGGWVKGGCPAAPGGGGGSARAWVPRGKKGRGARCARRPRRAGAAGGRRARRGASVRSARSSGLPLCRWARTSHPPAGLRPAPGPACRRGAFYWALPFTETRKVKAGVAAQRRVSRSEGQAGAGTARICPAPASRAACPGGPAPTHHGCGVSGKRGWDAWEGGLEGWEGRRVREGAAVGAVSRRDGRRWRGHGAAGAAADPRVLAGSRRAHRIEGLVEAPRGRDGAGRGSGARDDGRGGQVGGSRGLAGALGGSAIAVLLPNERKARLGAALSRAGGAPAGPGAQLGVGRGRVNGGQRGARRRDGRFRARASDTLLTRGLGRPRGRAGKALSPIHVAGLHRSRYMGPGRLRVSAAVLPRCGSERRRARSRGWGWKEARGTARETGAGVQVCCDKGRHECTAQATTRPGRVHLHKEKGGRQGPPRRARARHGGTSTGRGTGASSRTRPGPLAVVKGVRWWKAGGAWPAAARVLSNKAPPRSRVSRRTLCWLGRDLSRFSPLGCGRGGGGKKTPSSAARGPAP